MAQFKENPVAALEEFGIPTVPGATYHIVSQDEMQPNTATDVYLPYVDKPTLRTLDDDMLDSAAGGGILITKSNIITNKNAVAVSDAAVATEVAAATVSVEVAYG